MHSNTRFLCAQNWKDQLALVETLSLAYAVDFWGGAWKELVGVHDDNGQVLEQFGTFSADGTLFPETEALARYNHIDLQNDHWPVVLWRAAGEGKIISTDGRLVKPFWSLDRARNELWSFVAPVSEGGFGGEIVVLCDQGQIMGFTAFTTLRGQVAREAAAKRFPVKRLYFPLGTAEAVDLTLDELLMQLHPQDKTFAIFLDHAISERYRGCGLGATLFDARLQRIVEAGADVIVGRTLLDSPAQYFGNYRKRGLTPVAEDGTDEFSRKKHYFVTPTSDLVDRR